LAWEAEPARVLGGERESGGAYQPVRILREGKGKGKGEGEGEGNKETGQEAGDGGQIRVESCGAATADGEGKKGFRPAGRGAFPFALSGKKRLR